MPGKNRKRIEKLQNQIKVWWSIAKFQNKEEADRLFREFRSGPDKFLCPFMARDFSEDASANWKRIKENHGLTTQGDRDKEVRDYQEQAERRAARYEKRKTDGGFETTNNQSKARDMTTELDDEPFGSILEDLASECVWGADFIDKYLETGEQYSFENEYLHIGTALALVSQAVGDSYFYIGDNKNTTRVHPMIIQSSGTGKDPAFDFAQHVAYMDDMDFADLNEITNAGLIGTISDGDKQEGAAERADIIAFREATTLFRSAKSDHSRNLGENLNQILDGKEIRRQMADGTLTYQPSCTLVGTTYPPEDLDLQRLMNNGTLARFLYFFRPRGSDFRWRMSEELIKKSVESTDSAIRTVKIRRLGNTLSKISDAFDDGEQFNITSEVRELDVTERLEEIFDQYDEGTQDIVGPAITRYNLHFLRLSCLMAALDHCSTDVEKEHAQQARDIVEMSWTNLLEFYQQKGTEDTDKYLGDSTLDILKALQQEDGLNQSELSEKADISKRTIRNHDTLLEEEGLITIEQDGRTKKYYLNQDGSN